MFIFFFPLALWTFSILSCCKLESPWCFCKSEKLINLYKTSLLAGTMTDCNPCSLVLELGGPQVPAQFVQLSVLVRPCPSCHRDRNRDVA